MIIDNPPGEAKMSEVLMEFIEPYMPHAQTREALDKLLALATVAWNAALRSGSERDDFLRSMEQTLPQEARADMRSILGEMITRKETHFAGIERTIIDYQLTMTPNGPHLSVMSTFEKL
jgi:hypothetical protein